MTTWTRDSDGCVERRHNGYHLLAFQWQDNQTWHVSVCDNDLNVSAKWGNAPSVEAAMAWADRVSSVLA